MATDQDNRSEIPRPEGGLVLSGAVGEHEREWRAVVVALKGLVDLAARDDLEPAYVIGWRDFLREVYDGEAYILAKRYPATFRAAQIDLQHSEETDGPIDYTTTEMSRLKVGPVGRAALDDFGDHFMRWRWAREGLAIARAAADMTLRQGGDVTREVARVLAEHWYRLPDQALSSARRYRDPANRDDVGLLLGALVSAHTKVREGSDLQMGLPAMGPIPGDTQGQRAIVQQYAPEAAWLALRTAATWEQLITKARNWLRQEVRRERKGSPESVEGDPEQVGEAQTDDLARVLADPDASALLGMLKPVDQKIVIGIYQGNTPEQIADALGMTWGAVRTRQTRIKKKVRKFVDKKLRNM